MASFCASETAETGRIANGREQGDHVSRRRGGEKARGAAKGFSWVRAKLLFGALIRGLQNLESPFGKVLILLVGKCYLGVLIRGSQNLGAPCEGVRLVTFCIVQKVTKKHTGLRPATSIQSSIEEAFSRVFQRHEPKPVFRTKRRRKGFESVRGSGVTA